MRVVVSSAGETLDDPIDPRFGRAKRFLLVDTEGEKTQTIDNEQNVQAMQGAGVQAAQAVASLRPEYVITGHCGPKAFAVLQAAGIKVIVGVQGTAREAIQKLKSGELAPASGADVEGHWV